jgi:hypothetical protein
MRRFKIQLGLLALIFALGGCGANYHFSQRGACPTPGISPLASNCPSPDPQK